MNTTTVKVAPCSADPGMMPSATSPAGREGRRCATLAGKASTALNVSPREDDSKGPLMGRDTGDGRDGSVGETEA